MRILQIISAPAAGGAEVYVKDLSKALSGAGHQLYIGFIGHAKDIGRSALYEEEFLKDLTNSGIQYFFIGNEARRRPWLGAFRLRRFIRKNEIDICHCHLLYGLAFVAFAKVRCVYTHHAMEPIIGKLGYRLINFWVDQYIGISEVCARLLSSWTGQNVKTIFNGVDSEKFDLKKKSVNGEKLTFVTIGRITPVKNHALLVDAVSKLPLEIKRRVSFKIVGEGRISATNALKNQISALGLDELIELVGNINDVPEFLLSCDAFVMTSDREGFPISLIEASFCGLPCIVTNVGGCPEIIELCKNGVLVPPKDAIALSRAIASFVSDPQKMVYFSRNARKYSGRFSIERAANSHTHLYSDVLWNKE